MSKIQNLKIGQKSEKLYTKFIEAESEGHLDCQELSQIQQEASTCRRRLLKTSEVLKASLSQLPSSNIEDSSTLFLRMTQAATQLVNQIFKFEKSQEEALSKLIDRIKLKDQENQKLRKKLAQIDVMESVNLPEIHQEDLKAISKKRKQIEHQQKLWTNNKGVQATPPVLETLNQGLELSSYTLSLIKRQLQKNIQKAKIELTEVNNFTQEKELIGDEATLLAMKSENSYLILSSSKGMIMIENGTEVYKGSLQDVYDEAMVKDAVYIPTLNCYLIDLGWKIYRKNMDDLPPYEYLDCCWKNLVNCSFLYSDQHDKLIFFEEQTLLVVLDLKTKEIDIEIDLESEQTPFTNIFALRFIGENQEKMVLATTDGWLVIIKFHYGLKTAEILNEHWLDFSQVNFQELFSVAVCPKGEHLCVEIDQEEKNHDRKMTPYALILFKIENDTFHQVAYIDESGGNLGPKMALECYGYLMNHLMWIGLSSEENGTILIYDYDFDKNEFRELKEKRFSHQELNPVRLSKNQSPSTSDSCSSFLYTGELGRVMKLDLEVKDVSLRRKLFY